MLWESNFAPGVYMGVTNDEYHADPAISSTDVKEILRSPLEYWFNNWMNTEKVTKETTAGMKFGTFYHTLLLEPMRFNPTILYGQKSTSKEGCLGGDEYETMMGMKAMFESKPYHYALLKNGYPEVSIFWIDQETMLPCKCRLDYWKTQFVTDLKTSYSDVTDRALRNLIPDMGYDISGAMYMNGMDALRENIKSGNAHVDIEIEDKFIEEFMKSITRFVFLMQSKQAPYMTRAQAVTEPIYSCGNDKFRKALFIARDHFDRFGTDPWPDGHDMVEDMQIENLSSSIHYI